MRNFTNTNTNRFVFGQNQDRVVTADRKACAPAMAHLLRHWCAMHASMVAKTARALKRWAVEAVTGAVRAIGLKYPITGPQLCRQPLSSARRQASVRG
jgi:hypothetical protein